MQEIRNLSETFIIFEIQLKEIELYNENRIIKDNKRNRIHNWKRKNQVNK